MNKKTLVIEKLNLISLFYYLINFWKYEDIVFFSECKIFAAPWFLTLLPKIGNFRRVKSSDYPGIYFDIEKEATLNTNDKFYEIASQDNILIDFLYKFKDNYVVEIALQKILLGEYTIYRVKTYSLLYKIMGHSNSKIIFIPIDNIDFSSFLSKHLRPMKNRYDVPQTIRSINYLKDFTKKFSFMLYATGLIALLIIRKGFSFKSTKHTEYDIGLDTYSTGFSFDKPHSDGFIYGDGVFNPEKILHVVRTTLKCNRTKIFFTNNKYPYIEFKKISIPITYFIKRILVDYYLNALLTSSRCLSIKPQQVMLIRPTIAIINLIIENEIFYSKNHVKVFIARDEYGSTHIIRTMIANEHGCKTVGFNHGDQCMVQPAFSHIYSDYFCVWGQINSTILDKSLSYANSIGKHIRIIGAGIYGLDNAYNKMKDNFVPMEYENIAKYYKIITVFPTSCGANISVTEKHHVIFFKHVFSLIEKYNDIYIVVKPKNNCTDFINNTVFKELIPNERVCIDYTNWTYDLFPMTDLIIAIGITSVGLEGLVAGKNVLYHNIDLVGHYNPYHKYDKHLVAFTENEFYDNVDWFLSGKDLSDSVRDLTKEYGYKFDGRVVERFKDVILEALQTTKQAE